MTSSNDYVEVEFDWDYNPRDPDWVGEMYSRMVCFHSRYSFGDFQFDSSLKYEMDKENWWNPSSGHSAIDDFEEYIYKTQDPFVCLPLYLLDHSGLTIRTYPFNDGWDSSPIGFIYMSREKAREALGVKRLSSKARKRIKEWLVSEVEEYDRYLRGVELVTKEEAKDMETREIVREFGWEMIE